MNNNFNFVAPFYDILAHLVFGNNLIKSQIHFLSKIKRTDEVLILGGGTGELLESIPQCKSVSFLDLSEKMIVRAKNRMSKNPIDFICADFLTHDFHSKYDVIICPFFLDCFNESNLKEVISKIKNLLKDNGRLIVTDFQKTNDNRFFLNLMHYFFRVSTSLEAETLKNIHREVELRGFIRLELKYFYRNMIFSRLYGNL